MRSFSCLSLRLAALVLFGLAAGCNRPAASPPAEATAPAATTVSVTRPARKTVRHSIEQPGYNVEAFQQTPLFAKIAGYVEKVNADIGDRVTKGQVLAELSVPEMTVELKQKEAAVLQAEAEV